jgi:hypothetical protein
MSKRLADDEIDAIAERRERGEQCPAIARAIGRPANTVISACIRLGIEAPTPRPLQPDTHVKRAVLMRNGRPVRAFPPEEDAQLLALAGEGLGPRALGRALGRPSSSVTSRLNALARRDARAEQQEADHAGLSRAR